MRLNLNEKDALIIVDVQRDFCPGGALPVHEGDQVIPVLNEYIKIFMNAGVVIYATRDWHPSNHKSFKLYGGIWPPHCIKESKGAELHPDLKLSEKVKIISKAIHPSKEAYSGFEGTELKEDLIKKGIERIFVGGLATDYCVKNTVLDAIRFGFETILLIDAIHGVNLKPGGSLKAIEKMIKKGAKTITLKDIKHKLGKN